MTRVPFIVLVGACMGATGCMPLEQAPLVYSSKQQMGIGVAAGTPDSPGLDVNIGYKGLDAAFVPVIVAKKCDPKAGAKCDDVNYDLERVLGMHKLSSETKREVARLRSIDQQIKGDQKIFQANQEALDKKVAELQSIAARPAAVVKRDELQVAAASAPLVGQQATDLNDALARITAADDLLRTKSRNDREVELQSLRAESERLSTKIDDLEVTKRQIENDILASTGDSKMDALSVYGSFNGTGKGSKDGADLNIGKVFSTGVAAQNVSQGARLAAMSACLKEAGAIIKDAADDKLRQTALDNCR